MPKSVLIIDDSAAARRAVRRFLDSTTDWKVCGEAINGEDGVQKAQQLQPDAILLDMSMPEVNGIDTASTLRRLMPTVPVIMFTNLGKNQFFPRELSLAGIRQVVEKSDPQGLVRALAEAVRSTSDTPSMTAR